MSLAPAPTLGLNTGRDLLSHTPMHQHHLFLAILITTFPNKCFFQELRRKIFCLLFAPLDLVNDINIFNRLRRSSIELLLIAMHNPPLYG